VPSNPKTDFFWEKTRNYLQTISTIKRI